MIELLIFLIVIVGFFVIAGLVGEHRQLDQREEQERIREAIRKHAVRNISGNWMWEGNRHG